MARTTACLLLLACLVQALVFALGQTTGEVFAREEPIVIKNGTASCPAGTKETFVPYRTCTCEPMPDEKNMGSLIFVIDTTGTMGSVIEAVKKNIHGVMSVNTQFSNYVVATFGDPYVKNLRKTNNATEVSKFLDGLVASGGEDCPEFAMSGALDAATEADSNSVLILFTDASAKDPGLSDKVLTMLKDKKIRFYLVTSGNLCGVGSGQFDPLAKASDGQILNLQSSDFGKFMEFVKLAVSGKMSFTAFPSNVTVLDSVLKGDCCRYVNQTVCETIRCPAGTKEAVVPRVECSCEPVAVDKSLGSLIIVIDITASMEKIIDAVKTNITTIMNANIRFKNYVIATFGDPYSKNVLKSTNITEISNFLGKLVAGGGGDCPEYSMSGALDAAREADTNSIMILFSDASSKDNQATQDQLMQTLKDKKIRYFMVALGNICGKGTSQYETLANATGGLVSTLMAESFKKLMEFVRQAVNAKIDFSFFPTNATALDNVLKGTCCRNFDQKVCQLIETVAKPLVGPGSQT